MRFAVFYGDHWEFDGDDLTPVGVQAVVYPDASRNGNTGTLCIRGWDFYLLEPGGWVGVNGAIDLIDHVLHCKPEVVLKGRMMPREVYQDVVLSAIDQFQFPRKSAKAGGFECPQDFYIPEGKTV